MFEKEIKELFELAWRVSNETDYFVSFDITSHVHACIICIMNSKWEPRKKMDGVYTIYFDNELLKEESANQCKLAKAHLLRLLMDGRCPLNAKSNGIEALADNGIDNDSERASGGAEQAESVHS
jgi:hypothetical protein|uniref:Uncharacterized protein n=1 Tax=Siphoviridae sp. ctqK313 TaxID=2827946 RepID=A0A8S5TAM6_9CAUD|nr:MAG TPA: hypothetical protein [Siphoviridae sp. ctqK313]